MDIHWFRLTFLVATPTVVPAVVFYFFFWMTIMNVLKRSDIGEGAENMSEVDDLHFAERITLD